MPFDKLHAKIDRLKQLKEEHAEHVRKEHRELIPKVKKEFNDVIEELKILVDEV